MNETLPKEAPAWAWKIVADFRELMRGREDEVHQAVERWKSNGCVPFREIEDVPDAVARIVAVAMIADKFDSGNRANAIGLKAVMPILTPYMETALKFHLPCIDQDGTLDWPTARQEVEASWRVVKRHFSPPSKPATPAADAVCRVCGWKHTADFTRWENPHTGKVDTIQVGRKGEKTKALILLEGLHKGMESGAPDVATAAAMGDKKCKSPRVADLLDDKADLLFQGTGRGRGKIRPPDPGKTKKKTLKR